MILVTLGEVLVAISIFVLGILAVRWRVGPWIWDSLTHRFRLDVEDFDMGMTGLKIGKGLTAMIEEEFKRIKIQKDSPSVHVVEGPIAFEIPADIKSRAPSIGVISKLIDWAFPQKVITLHGCLHKTGECSAGLTMKLVNNQTRVIMAACKMRQEEYTEDSSPKKGSDGENNEKNPKKGSDGENNENTSEDKDPTPYFSLAEPAALWISFQLSTNKVKKKEKEKELIRTLYTKDWQSYVCSRMALRSEEQGDKDRAREMYKKALKKDRDNRLALLNLGNLEIERVAEENKATEENKPKGYEGALDLLEQAKSIAKLHEKDLEWLR